MNEKNKPERAKIEPAMRREKSLEAHLYEYELIRRAAEGEGGEDARQLLPDAIRRWAESGERRLMEIEGALWEARGALSMSRQVRLRLPKRRSGLAKMSYRGRHLAGKAVV